jgi:hypothetical protein
MKAMYVCPVDLSRAMLSVEGKGHKTWASWASLGPSYGATASQRQYPLHALGFGGISGSSLQVEERWVGEQNTLLP